MNGIRFPLYTCIVFFTVPVPWSQKGLVNALPASPNTFSTFFRSSCYVLLWAGVLFFNMTLKMNPSLKNIGLLVSPFWLLRKLRSFYSRINLKRKGRWLFGKTSSKLITICQVHRNLIHRLYVNRTSTSFGSYEVYRRSTGFAVSNIWHIWMRKFFRYRRLNTEDVC